jgi:hypothetical protein
MKAPATASLSSASPAEARNGLLSTAPLSIMAIPGTGLVLVHFAGVTPRHPIMGRSRGGNLAGRLSRELVAEQAGQHVETTYSEGSRTFFYRADDVQRAAALLVEGVKRIGLAQHAQVVFVDTLGRASICWPSPANGICSPAEVTLSGIKKEGTNAIATRRASNYSISALRPDKSTTHQKGLTVLLRSSCLHFQRSAGVVWLKQIRRRLAQSFFPAGPSHQPTNIVK